MLVKNILMFKIGSHNKYRPGDAKLNDEQVTDRNIVAIMIIICCSILFF